MPVIFRAQEEEYREKWLPKDFGSRLETIRRLVKHLHMSKAKIPQVKWFTPHGEDHSKAVEDLMHSLIPKDSYTQLTEDERFFLLGSAWLHDIGMLRGIMGDEYESISDEQIREEHHRRSEQYIIRNYREIGVGEPEKEAFGLLARFHRRRCPLNECPELIHIPEHNAIRLRLLAAYLRLSDALHVDQTRAPDAQYAISLAYDIPNKSKLHWLRSKFVLGIDINVVDKEIAVHLKYPKNIQVAGEQKRQVMERTLNSIYDLIVQDLTAELDTVKDVLFAANISYFLRITKKIHSVEFDQQLLRDINSVFNYYFLLDNPSSSSLYTLMLQSIKEILESYNLNIDERRDDVQESALKAVGSFLDEINDRVLKSRKCHTGLRNFVDKIRKKVKDNKINALRDEITFRSWLLERKRTGVRFSAFRYFNEKLKNEFWKDFGDTFPELKFPRKKGDNAGNEPPENDKKESEVRKETPTAFPFNILLYGYSELVIKSLCGFRDAVIARLIKPYYDDIKEARESNEDIYPWATTREDIKEEKAMNEVFEELGEKEKKSPGFRDKLLSEEYKGKKRLPLLHKVDLEKRASDFFNIFVCEGQPKNRTTWGGRTIYHDGTRFAITLASHAFTNIYVIPDAAASSLIVPYEPNLDLGYPKIHFVMVGANGYDNNKFLHSAGHTMVAAITSFAKTLENDKDDRFKQKSGGLPALILSIITDKYKKGEYNTEGDDDEDNKKNGKNKDSKSEKPVIETDGWKFRGKFVDEPIRTHVFISQDQELRQSLRNEAPTALFYNPREDKIPIDWVDVVITEKSWLDKEYEEKWDGKFFTEHSEDSKVPDNNNPAESDAGADTGSEDNSTENNESLTSEKATKDKPSSKKVSHPKKKPKKS